jgi:hypothetical protein
MSFSILYLLTRSQAARRLASASMVSARSGCRAIGRRKSAFIRPRPETAQAQKPMRDQSSQGARRRGGRQRRPANAVAASKRVPVEVAAPSRVGVKFPGIEEYPDKIVVLSSYIKKNPRPLR